MKSRTSSPQTSPQVVKRYRVNSSSLAVAGAAGATDPVLLSSSVGWENSSSLSPASTMNGATLQPLGATTNAHSVAPNSGLVTSTPNGTRKASADTNTTITPSRYDALKTANGNVSHSVSNSPLSPASGENSPATWSSAVGPATTSGKSGRVIERLMSENDKLKRDLNAQLVRCQELERNLHTYKPQVEALRQENDNLTHLRGVDENLIARRDRKIEELKAELAMERQRREASESLARQREREKEEVEEKTKRELQQMKEESKHATVHADILLTSHKQLAAEYKARAESWTKDMRAAGHDRKEDRSKLDKLEVVGDQMRQESERQRKLNLETLQVWAALREEFTSKIRLIDQTSERTMERFLSLETEMTELCDKMRWSIGVHKAFPEDFINEGK